MDILLKQYKKGLSQFENDIEKVLSILGQGENICFCSAPKMGDNTFIDYLAYKLRSGNDFEVIYSSKNDINFKSIREKIIKGTKKPLLLLVPWLHNPIPGLYKQLEDLYLDSREYKIRSVIRVHYNFLLHPKRYFPKSIRPVSYIYFRKPMNFSQTKVVINQRRELNGWDIDSKFERQIYRLSGGIPGLIKRLCSFLNSYGNLKEKDLLSYPAICMALIEFEEIFKDFQKSKLKQFGLIDSKGKIISPLIEAKIIREKKEDKIELTPQMETVFNYMRKREGEIVRIDELHDEISEEKEFSLWGNYKLIARLKKKIAPLYRIRNIKGKGYILETV